MTSLFPDVPWTKHAGLTCVECPSCGFCFDEDHEDMEGGYSCPNCAQTALHRELEDLRAAVREVLDYENQPSRTALSNLRAVAGKGERV